MGRSGEERYVPTGTSAGDLLALLVVERPALDRLQPILLLMINHEYADRSQLLADGDEVALIPPVSGGSAESVEPAASPARFRVQTEAIDPRAVEARVFDESIGGIVTFIGTVRNHARGKTVVALDYEAYQPAAERMLIRIGGEVEERWGVTSFAIVHRTGMLQVGEVSVVIVAAAAHRAEAFAACEYAINRIKEIVPIWKQEHYADGTHWVGTEAEYQAEVKAALARPAPN